MKAIILFGHGARDVRWREPFDRLAAIWKAKQPQVMAQLAFLEIMEPSLSGAIANLVSQGADQITIVPVFFGQGSHLRNDFPVLLEECRTQYPQIALSTTLAVGEDDGILQAIVDFVAKAL